MHRLADIVQYRVLSKRAAATAAAAAAARRNLNGGVDPVARGGDDGSAWHSPAVSVTAGGLVLAAATAWCVLCPFACDVEYDARFEFAFS